MPEMVVASPQTPPTTTPLPRRIGWPVHPPPACGLSLVSMADQQDCKFEAPDPDPQLVELLKQAYRGNSIIKSQGQVKNLGVKIKDFDGTELELYECTYKLGPVEAPRLIKKGYPCDEKFAANYEFLSNFRHPTAVQVDNYYVNAEYLVLSLVNGTFSRWFNTRNYNDLFTPEGKMLPLIRQMIIELSTLVESLLAREKAPVDLGLNDLYIELLPDGTPKLQVLITEVTIASTTAHIEGAWASVKKIVQECFTSRGFHPNAATQSFCNFIGVPNKNIRPLLEDFPDHWDNSRKGVFLLESCAKAGQVSKRINNSGLCWPLDGRYYPQLLLDLIEHSEEKSEYNERFPYDYVKLSRNTYKHFKSLTYLLKAQLGGDTDGLLRQIEEWSPNIWSMLYTALNAP